MRVLLPVVITLLPVTAVLCLENLSTNQPFFYTGLGLSLSGSLFAGAVESISRDTTALWPQQLLLSLLWFMIPITIEPTLITMATYDNTVVVVLESISISYIIFSGDVCVGGMIGFPFINETVASRVRPLGL